MKTKFAVIDTETNWHDEVMSIGAIIANKNYEIVTSRYYILPKEARVTGMFSKSMYSTKHEIIEDSRTNVIEDLLSLFNSFSVKDLFAYNASFDKNHLPELDLFNWHDIMKIAAYKQHNPCIDESCECCKTGRLRRGYGVEPMLRLLSGVDNYNETHNAILDAKDELLIMELLDKDIDVYPII